MATNVQASWTAPTVDEEGNPIVGQLSYKVFVNAVGVGTFTVEAGAGNSVVFGVGSYAGRDLNISVVAIGANGKQSAHSNTIILSVPAAPLAPAPPGSLIAAFVS